MKRNRILGLLMALVLVVGLVLPGQKVFAADQKVITILHTNDVHGNVVENEKDGKLGYAKLKTFADSKENAILVDAGDVLHGTTFATISKGQSIVDLMNLVGYKAMAPGNHDYNYGSDRLKELATKAEFPILSANVVDKDGKLFLKDRTIIDVDGVKVGIFGITTPETRTKSNPKNTEGLGFTNYIEAARVQVAQLKEEGSDVVVALVHLGLDPASKERSDVLAKEVAGIDLIIDGHSHTDLANGKLENGVLIAQTGDHTKNIGEVTLVVEDGKVSAKSAKLHPYEELKGLEANKEILGKIEEVEKANKPYLDRVVGKTAVDLDGLRDHVRTGETNLGNLVTDAMLNLTKADVALTNGGGIRESIAKGDVTMGQILQTFPFANYPVVIEVTGQTIKDALEYGVDSAPEVVGKFPHIAGMTFKYDQNQKPGSRVFDVVVGKEALDLNKTYKLVTNDFMAGGGDGYEMFKGTKKLSEYPLLSEVLADYIEKEKVVEPKVEGRVVAAAMPKTEEQVGFTDIKGHWGEEFINSVVEDKIFMGTSKTTFEPNANITRAMIVTTLYRLEGMPEVKNPAEFSDVKTNMWYSDPIAWAAANDIVKGYEDKSYKPDQEVTREEMAAIISRYLAYKAVPVTSMLPEAFADQDKIATWALTDVQTVQLTKIMSGKPGNLFDPQGKATRAELAKVMYQINLLVNAEVKKAA
ncbi:5'-nucleotidase C-terminal domain-containing protein [Neofamilia massiliensis]|uniref:5'-nucleotidase C-terminal domain-containing protein n=1 Tax=Neofamilia massiliensis TaxID=1673724 RepID=UPI0006BB7F70|nr:5'-nucleotidase C-terminal domain-containing protein [Neofamilia massiliensis]